MKKSTLIFLIFFIFTGIAYANSQVTLTLHSDVDLGFIDSSIYKDATFEGGGFFQALISDKKKIKVTLKNKENWRLLVEATDVGKPLRFTKNILSNFYFEVDEGPWTKFSSLKNAVKVIQSDKEKERLEIEYKYQPDINDVPGSYKVKLYFQVQIYEENTWQPAASDTVRIFWHVKPWAIVKTRSEVNLGTIDASLYNKKEDKFSFLESTEELGKVFVICNDPDGWNLEVSANDVNYPGSFSLSLLKNFYWKVEDEVYRSGENLDKIPAVVDRTKAQGKKVYQLRYRYLPSLNDTEGNYFINLKYRLTSANYQTMATDTTKITWNVLKWTIFSSHGDIDLGVLDKSKISIDSKGKLHFIPLKSLDNPLLVMSNSTRGWKVKLGISSFTTPLLFKGDLLKDFQWRLDKEKYQSAERLYKKEALVADEKKGPLKKTYYIDYRYLPDIDDIQGEYKITLKYTVYTK